MQRIKWVFLSFIIFNLSIATATTPEEGVLSCLSQITNLQPAPVEGSRPEFRNYMDFPEYALVSGMNIDENYLSFEGRKGEEEGIYRVDAGGNITFIPLSDEGSVTLTERISSPYASPLGYSFRPSSSQSVKIHEINVSDPNYEGAQQNLRVQRPTEENEWPYLHRPSLETEGNNATLSQSYETVKKPGWMSMRENLEGIASGSQRVSVSAQRINAENSNFINSLNTRINEMLPIYIADCTSRTNFLLTGDASSCYAPIQHCTTVLHDDTLKETLAGFIPEPTEENNECQLNPGNCYNLAMVANSEQDPSNGPEDVDSKTNYMMSNT